MSSAIKQFFFRRLTLELATWVFQDQHPASGASLGRGAFGTVRVHWNKSSKQMQALKICDKSLTNEAAILKKINNARKHPNIVWLHDFFTDDTNVYLFFEYVQGPNLYQLVRSKGRIDEDEAKSLVAQVADALDFLHGQNIVHRDVTLVNLLTCQSNGRTLVKLCDFGLAVHADATLTQVCGTVDYLAPEMLSGCGYGCSVDVWALGVATFYLLSGRWPFRNGGGGGDIQSICQCIVESRLQLKAKIGALSLSDDGKDLIRRMLCYDPKQRTSAWGVLQHLWCAPTERRQRTTVLSTK